MITVTKVAGVDPHGTRVPVSSLDELAALIVADDWCPGTFRNDYRNLDNFEQMDVIGLDVDGGMSLADAEAAFKDYACIIGTSRNHQKVKHPGEPSEQPACDRFRVVLLADRPITNDADFKLVFAALKQKFPAIDPAAKDAGRFFFACRECVFSNSTGTRAAVDELVAAGRATVAASSPVSPTSVPASATHGSLSARTWKFIGNGAAPGSWNSELYRAARDLNQNGYSYEEATALLERPTKLAGNLGNLDATDTTTIDSAYGKAPNFPPRPAATRAGKMHLHEFCDQLRADGARDPAKRIEMDERTGNIFEGRNAIELNVRSAQVREQLSRAGPPLSKEDIHDAYLTVADQNRFNPVREYFDSLVWDGAPRLADVPNEILGRPADPLHSVYLTKWAISAVARTYSPGCKVDTILILQGAQGGGKSTFFKVMAGAWFSDSPVAIDNKDGFLPLSRNLVIEWAEMDSLIRARNASTVKQFISSSEDQFRPPYAKSIVSVPRCSIFVGTTNEVEFLGDDTGSRRFWIIAGLTQVDIEKTKVWRDQLWAEAVYLYHQGKLWHLDAAEERLREERNADHIHTDTWLEAIRSYLLGRTPPVTVHDVLESALSIPTKDQGQAQKNRAANCLTKLGWKSARTKHQRFWLPIDSASS